jgi:hypothetical protein
MLAVSFSDLRGLSGKEEQRPDQNRVEHDDCENDKGKGPRKKLLIQHCTYGHHRSPCLPRGGRLPKIRQPRAALPRMLVLGQFIYHWGFPRKLTGIYPVFQVPVICIDYATSGWRHDPGPTDKGQVLMSLNQLRLINRSLVVVLIALYLALGFSVASDLLPGSAIAILLNGSKEH